MFEKKIGEMRSRNEVHILFRMDTFLVYKVPILQMVEITMPQLRKIFLFITRKMF